MKKDEKLINNKKISNNIVYQTMLEILMDNTNEEKYLTIAEINNYLNEKIGVTKDRHTIESYYNQALKTGIDIVKVRGRVTKYYIRTPRIEDYELKIIVDCLSSNKCITHSKTRALQEKLCNFTNKDTREKITKSALIENRSKTKNEQVFYNIDKIDRAINNSKKIKFNYLEVNEKRELFYRVKNNKVREYKALPIQLLIQNENYYLMLIIESKDTIAFYRVDRIQNIEILEEEARLNDYIYDYDNFDPIEYSSKCFNMYSGVDEVKVELKIPNWMISYLFDELGDRVNIRKINDDIIIAEFNAIYSAGLVNWILGLGSNVRVLNPPKLEKEIKDTLEELLESYNNTDKKLENEKSIWK